MVIDSPVAQVFSRLPVDDQRFITDLEQRIKNGKVNLDTLCFYLYTKLGKENVINFASLAPDSKIQACMEYITIGILAENFTKSDISELVSG